MFSQASFWKAITCKSLMPALNIKPSKPYDRTGRVN